MMLMMQNFRSKPKISCNTITDVTMITGLRYFLTKILAATFRFTTAGFGFFRIDRNAKYPRVA